MFAKGKCYLIVNYMHTNKELYDSWFLLYKSGRILNFKIKLKKKLRR